MDVGVAVLVRWRIKEERKRMEKGKYEVDEEMKKHGFQSLALQATFQI